MLTCILHKIVSFASFRPTVSAIYLYMYALVTFAVHTDVIFNTVDLCYTVNPGADPERSLPGGLRLYRPGSRGRLGPCGVQGQRPGGGSRGAKPPGKF